MGATGTILQLQPRRTASPASFVKWPLVGTLSDDRPATAQFLCSNFTLRLSNNLNSFLLASPGTSSSGAALVARPTRRGKCHLNCRSSAAVAVAGAAVTPCFACPQMETSSSTIDLRARRGHQSLMNADRGMLHPRPRSDWVISLCGDSSHDRPRRAGSSNEKGPPMKATVHERWPARAHRLQPIATT